jgi:hypothetical protein
MHLRSFLAAGLALASVAIPPASADSRPAGRREIPFDIALQGDAHLSPTPDPCLVLNAEVAQGMSDALGKLAWTDLEIANFCSVPGGVGVVAQFALAAPNGDKLFGTFETTGHPGADGLLHIEGTFRIVGGTGGYAGAVGAGSIAALADRPDASGVGAVAGTMSGRLRLSD